MAAGATPRLMRTLNERTLLDHLRRAGPTSRAQLARDTGLSKPTVSLALANLERAGLARPAGRLPSTRGRAAVLYESDPTVAYVVGIDIGRDGIRVAGADLAGAGVARSDARSRARSGAALVRRVAALAHQVVEEAGVTWAKVAHTVVGAPGVVDAVTGRLELAPNLPAWGRPGVLSELRDALPPSVTLENDANLAAIGERTYGSGRDATTFVYVSVGTGIGMGIVLGGGVGGNVDLLRPRLEERLARLTPLRARVAEGELGRDAIVLGAIATALDTARERVFAERAGSAA